MAIKPKSNLRRIVTEKILFPCPFCGGEAVMETITTAMEKKPRYSVRCTGNDCRVSLDWDWWSAEAAANAWNRRADK